jgi:hypothetical protein
MNSYGRVCLFLSVAYSKNNTGAKPLEMGSKSLKENLWLLPYKKTLPSDGRVECAEEEGFEPPVPLGTTVFKTAAIDHSATPLGKLSMLN